jgi:GTP-sensing pleiotropic transcriptional regulator CodY
MTERNPNRDDESGEYTEGYTPADAVDALRELDGAATTSEIGDAMGCARRTAYNKLTAAEENGDIRSRDAGRSKLWLLDE